MEHGDTTGRERNDMTTPSRKDRTRPAELLLLSLAIAVFTGLCVLLVTRDLAISVIFFGVAFILALVVFAMLSITSKPNRDEEIDLGEQNDSGH